MSAFREFRNLELSAVAHIRTQIDANFNNINVVKSYKDAEQAELPVVCVRLSTINPIPKEIGNTTRRNQFGLIIDIFAKSDGQRLDLASLLTDELNDGFVYNEYTKESTVETPTSAPAGRVRLIDYTQNSKLDFGEDVHMHDRFRHVISVVLERSGV